MGRALRQSQGFTLIELITVLVLVAVLGTLATVRSLPSLTFQMQASRDSVIAAFFSAQQKAMAQTRAVRLITTANSIDIRLDANGDGSFSASESLSVGGVQYPLALVSSQTLTSTQFDFDRLGKTSSATLNLSQAGTTINMTVSANGAIN